jgi:hypothetical protein
MYVFPLSVRAQICLPCSDRRYDVNLDKTVSYIDLQRYGENCIYKTCGTQFCTDFNQDSNAKCTLTDSACLSKCLIAQATLTSIPTKVIPNPNVCMSCHTTRGETNSLIYDYDLNGKIDEYDIALYGVGCYDKACGNNLCPDFYQDKSITCDELDIGCMGYCYLPSVITITPIPRLCQACESKTYDRNNNGVIDTEDIMTFSQQCLTSACSDVSCADYYQDSTCSAMDLGCMGACYIRSRITPTSSITPSPTGEASPTLTGDPPRPCNCVEREGTYSRCNLSCVDGNNISLANFACAGIDNCTGPALRTKGDVNGDKKTCLDDYIELVLTFNGQYINDNARRLKSDFQGNNFIDNEDKSIFDANYDSELCSTNF